MMNAKDMQFLAGLGVVASNHALTQQADIIFNALALTHQGSEVAITTKALNAFNRGDFKAAVDVLTPWCEQQPVGIAHALLALVYQTWGYATRAQTLIACVLNESENPPAIQLVKALGENHHGSH